MNPFHDSRKKKVHIESIHKRTVEKDKFRLLFIFSFIHILFLLSSGPGTQHI